MIIHVETDVYPYIEQVSFFFWWPYEETYRGHMVSIRRFRAFIFYTMSCVRSYILQSTSCCSHDISHFVQGIWSFLDVFVPLYMTIGFGIGLFAAWHFSLLCLQLDRIVIIFSNMFRFPSWQKRTPDLFRKALSTSFTCQAPVVVWGHHCYRCEFPFAQAKDQLGF